MLSEAQGRLLALLSRGACDIFSAAAHLERPLFAISTARTSLERFGLIEERENYDGPMLITPAGRRALQARADALRGVTKASTKAMDHAVDALGPALKRLA